MKNSALNLDLLGIIYSTLEPLYPRIETYT